MANVSKVERQKRPPKPKFEFTGIVVGILIGAVLGAGLEVAAGKPNKWIMFAGMVVCGLLAATFEAARYWRCKRRWQAFRKS